MMAVYRIYLVHRDGTLEPGEAFHCATDLEARGRLRRSHVPDVVVELWQGGRFIGDLPRAEQHAPSRR